MERDYERHLGRFDHLTSKWWANAVARNLLIKRRLHCEQTLSTSVRKSEWKPFSYVCGESTASTTISRVGRFAVFLDPKTRDDNIHPHSKEGLETRLSNHLCFWKLEEM